MRTYVVVGLVALVVNLPLAHSLVTGVRPPVVLVVVIVVADLALAAVAWLRRYAPVPEDEPHS